MSRSVTWTGRALATVGALILTALPFASPANAASIRQIPCNQKSWGSWYEHTSDGGDRCYEGVGTNYDDPHWLPHVNFVQCGNFYGYFIAFKEYPDGSSGSLHDTCTPRTNFYLENVQIRGMHIDQSG